MACSPRRSSSRTFPGLGRQLCRTGWAFHLPKALGNCARKVQNSHVALEDAHMTTCSVATTSMLIAIACAGFTGCNKIEENLPPAVTSSVTRDFNQGDALRTAAHYTDDAQILPPRHPLIEGKPAIAAFFEANIDKYIGFGNETTWSVVRGDVGVEQ